MLEIKAKNQPWICLDLWCQSIAVGRTAIIPAVHCLPLALGLLSLWHEILFRMPHCPTLREYCTSALRYFSHSICRFDWWVCVILVLVAWLFVLIYQCICRLKIENRKSIERGSYVKKYWFSTSRARRASTLALRHGMFFTQQCNAFNFLFLKGIETDWFGCLV